MGGKEERDHFNDRFFQDSNRIRFETPVDDAAKSWWQEQFFDKFGLTPESVGDLLSKSWKHDKQIVVMAIDGSDRRFSLKVEGAFGDGNFWFHARTLDMRGSVINADRMFVFRGPGVARRFMGDLVDFARMIEIPLVRLDAEHIGRYAWLRVGFVPDRGSWNRLTIELGQRLLLALPDLGERRFLEVLAMTRSPYPETARELARLSDPVSSAELFDDAGKPQKVPLGKALFLEVGSNWSGELRLDDAQSVELVQRYVNGAET